jgi:hypothetical protein
MKKSLLGLAVVVMLSGCGYSAVDNEFAGQVKKVVHQTPIFCAERYDTDISLGVLRNGVGSMSQEDVWLTVPNQDDQKLLKQAAETGQIVKVKYDVYRVTWCWQDHVVRGVELTK